MLKRLMAGLALSGLMISLAAPTALAQTPDDLLKERKAKKLSGAWLKNASWVMDYDAAKKQAADGSKLIFGYFTRSYAP